MIIRDKQDLRKCVKQNVRRCEVVETAFRFDVVAGECGIASMLGVQNNDDCSLNQLFALSCSGTPFEERHQALIAALDAMQLPVHDLDKAEAIASGYDRSSYLSALLSAMRARRVLVQVECAKAELFSAADARFAPLLIVEQTRFTPERYGVPYERIAEEISQIASQVNARDLAFERFDVQALAYCLLPVCEDEALVLHLHLRSEEEIDVALALLRSRPKVRALLSADAGCISYLMKKAAGMDNVLVRIDDLGKIREALSVLGTHFHLYASRASLPEEMIGRWVCAREEIWGALSEAYLPLARSGYELRRESIEADVEMLFCGNFEKLYL